ncbi:MAG: STAS domain-containing protein [Anaerolineae bacterium]|nr:STAS domain-containing protein [Anaerolineae bacterium]
MSITHHKLAGNVYLVEVSGPLNVTHAEEVGRYFEKMAAKGVERVVVNLAGVPFIDGPGLAVLVAGYKLFGNGQNFRLAGLQIQPKLVLELTGFDRIFQVLNTAAESAANKSSRQIQSSHHAPAYVPQLTGVLANPA